MAFKVIFSILALLLFCNAEAELDISSVTGATCVFIKTSACYITMPQLGGNMSLSHAETMDEIDANCNSALGGLVFFTACMETPCTSVKVDLEESTKNITTLVTNLCQKGDIAQKFIDSATGCYNKNLGEIQKCVPKLDVEADKKTFCKTNTESVDCVKNIIKTCDTAQADFLDNLITTYNSYAPLLCGACGLNPTSLWILAALSIVMISFGLN